MGLFTKDIKTMDDLLLHGLQDIYYAEQQITKALPKMIEKATNRDLSTGLKNHLEETRKQIERLDKAAADAPELAGITVRALPLYMSSPAATAAIARAALDLAGEVRK